MRNHILFLIVVFLSNTIQAFTGFAGTMLAMPASMLLLGMERASAVLNVIAIVVSLLVLYAVTVLKEKKDFRATMAMVWVFLNSMLLVSHIRGGYFDLEAVGLLAAAIPVTLLSVWLGNKLHDKIDQALFLKITYVLLLLSGLLLIL